MLPPVLACCWSSVLGSSPSGQGSSPSGHSALDISRAAFRDSSSWTLGVARGVAKDRGGINGYTTEHVHSSWALGVARGVAKDRGGINGYTTEHAQNMVKGMKLKGQATVKQYYKATVKQKAILQSYS